MNPATLQVSIEADMKQLEAQFSAIEKAFLVAGQRASKAFTYSLRDLEKQFGDSGSRAAAAFRGELSSVMSKDVKDATVAPIARAVTKAVSEGVERATERARPAGVKLGASVGREMSREVAKQSEGILAREFSDRKIGALVGSVVGLSMADRMIRNIAEVISGDQSIGEAIAGSIRSVPVIGAIQQLGEAISTAIMDRVFGEEFPDMAAKRIEEIAYEADMKAANKAHEDKIALEKKRIADAVAGDRKREQDRLDGIIKTGEVTSSLERELFEKNLDFEAEYQAANARAVGDEEKALTIEMERDIAKERDRIYAQYGADERGGLGMLGSQEEQDAFKKVLENAENLIRDQFAYKKYLHKQSAEDEQKKNAETHVKKLEEIQTEIEAAELAADQEARAAQSAGVGSAATALGSFTFDAYPDAEKRRNDQRIVKTLEAVRDKIGGFA